MKTAWKGKEQKKNHEKMLTAKRDLCFAFITTGNSTLRYIGSIFPWGFPKFGIQGPPTKSHLHVIPFFMGLESASHVLEDRETNMEEKKKS